MPSLTCLVCASLLPNGGCLTVDERGPLIWSPDSPRRSLPSVGFIRSAVPSELLPHKLLQSDDCWMSSDRRRICSAVNYSARSISTSLREVWGPLASPLSAAPAVSHHQSLASRPAHFLTYYGEPRDKVLPPRSWRLKPSAVQLVSQGARVAFYPNFDWSLSPVTICPLISHLFKHNHRTTEQLQPSPRCHSVAFSIKKLYDSERSFELIISHDFFPPLLFQPFSSLLYFVLRFVISMQQEWPSLNLWLKTYILNFYFFCIQQF